MKNNLLVILSLIVLSGCLLAAPVKAQAPDDVIVTHTATNENESSVDLNAFFTVIDVSGRPISNPSIETASIELLGGDSAPIPATVEKPNSPFYVALLLDASGSMANVIGQVKEAAKVAIDSAPPTAFFSVIQFNEEFRPVVDFTNDHARVKDAIDRVQSISGSSTCLYDSVYDAIDLLEEQTGQPQLRRAIILFTDGKDEKRDQSGPCSFYGYNDVISRATRRDAPTTPLHTIGLCSDASCGNINKGELNGFAADTRAFSATGGQQNLRELFQTIMDGLNSQMVARAAVYPRQGENQAALAIRLRDVETPLATTFSFFSSRDYAVPTGPVGVLVTGLTYDRPNDVYQLSLGISGASTVRRVIVQVWDNRSGVQLTPDNTFENPGPTLQFERQTDGMEAGREYAFRVLATNQQDELIQNDEGETILAESIVTYEPEQRAAVEFSIVSVTPLFDQEQLLVDLDIANSTAPIDDYEGRIVDSDTGQLVAEFGPDVYDDERLEIALPPSIQQLAETREYAVTVRLVTKDDRAVTSEPYEFKVVPPPAPSFLERIATNIGLPVIVMGLVIVLLSVVGWWAISRKSQPREPTLPRAKKHTKEFSRPPADLTQLAGDSGIIPQPASRLRMKVSLPGQAPHQLVLTQFPCKIGRDPKSPQNHLKVIARDDGFFLNIVDPNISRNHAQISLQGNRFLIADMGSRNGTFKDEAQLPAGKPEFIHDRGPTNIRLGKSVHLEVEPVA